MYRLDKIVAVYRLGPEIEPLHFTILNTHTNCVKLSNAIYVCMYESVHGLDVSTYISILFINHIIMFMIFVCLFLLTIQ